MSHPQSAFILYVTIDRGHWLYQGYAERCSHSLIVLVPLGHHWHVHHFNPRQFYYESCFILCSHMVCVPLLCVSLFYFPCARLWLWLSITSLFVHFLLISLSDIPYHCHPKNGTKICCREKDMTLDARHHLFTCSQIHSVDSLTVERYGMQHPGSC